MKTENKEHVTWSYFLTKIADFNFLNVRRDHTPAKAHTGKHFLLTKWTSENEDEGLTEHTDYVILSFIYERS